MTGDPTPSWFRDIVDGASEVIPLLPAGTPSPSRQSAPPRSGIIVVDKPAGMTSHDVVQVVRRASGERRVGHAGTLDPAATGVLVVCLGSATRIVEAIQDQPKVYEAIVALGVSTATYDAEGEVTERHDAAGVDRSTVELALEAFRGPIMQVPPMYSALKHKGRPLYELAREGTEIERAPRPVTIHELILTEFAPPLVSLRLTASKGTYVRSLAHDLGQALGTGAHLAALRRTAVGRFTDQEAVSLATLVDAFNEDWWPRIVHALDQALVDYSALLAPAEVVAEVRQGRQFGGPAPDADTTTLVRLYGPDGVFVALVAWDPFTERWQPERVFAGPPADGSRS